MSDIVVRRAFLASLVVSLVLIGVLAAGPPHWTGDPEVSVSGRPMLAQAVSCPVPAKDAEAEAKKSEDKQKSDKDKPPVGLCRNDWIHGWEMRTYRCDILFGPA